MNISLSISSVPGQGTTVTTIKKFAINIGLINFKGDMVEIKMNIPYKFENSQEALEELCALIRNLSLIHI